MYPVGLLKEEQTVSANAFQFCSLGDHCLLNTLLKKAKLKTQSYPLDWVVSNMDMLLYVLSKGMHVLYTEQERLSRFPKSKIFYHHNINKPETTQYLKRCEARFHNLRNCQRTVFLITVTHLPLFNHRTYTEADFLHVMDFLRTRYNIARPRLIVFYIFPKANPGVKVPASRVVEFHQVEHSNIKDAIVTPQAEAQILRVLQCARRAQTPEFCRGV